LAADRFNGLPRKLISKRNFDVAVAITQ